MGTDENSAGFTLEENTGKCDKSRLEAIDESEYLSILSGLIEQKKRSVKASTDYERNGKLIRFAIGRGFEMEEILRCVKQVDADVEYLG